MNPKATGITRKGLITKAKKAGINVPGEMSDKKLGNTSNKYLENRRSHKIHDRFSRLAQKNIDERQYLSKSHLRKAKSLKHKSPDDLKLLSKLRRIHNYNILSKETLFIHC